MMKRISWLVAALASVSLIGSASAADVPAGPPPYVPQYAPVLMAPVYDWNGFYIGGHVGGAWLNQDVTATGPLGGLVGGNSFQQSSFAGGGLFGVNFAMWPVWMFGLEADISATFLHGTVVATNLGGTLQVQNDSKTDMFGTLRGRTGYIWNNWLFFASGGYAWADSLQTQTLLLGTIGGATAVTSQQLSTITSGWTAGAGMEWAFAPAWRARLEYLHYDFGSHGFMFTNTGLQRNVDTTVDTVRMALVYRFNLLSLGP
jgi:outer membrane immunogenic protein